MQLFSASRRISQRVASVYLGQLQLSAQLRRAANTICCRLTMRIMIVSYVIVMLLCEINEVTARMDHTREPRILQRTHCPFAGQGC